MKTIRNTTHQPLRVPLPQGKVLHLGPMKEGEIGAGAEDHPPFKELVEAGKIEVLGEGDHHWQRKSEDNPAHASSQASHSTELSSHHRGER